MSEGERERERERERESCVWVYIDIYGWMMAQFAKSKAKLGETVCEKDRVFWGEEAKPRKRGGKSKKRSIYRYNIYA